MVARLYKAILRLYPADVRNRFGEEMVDVFLAASSEARQQGRREYVEFSAKEIAGLLLAVPWRRRTMRSKLAVPACGLAGLAIAAAIAYSLPVTFTSRAFLRSVPAHLNESLVPSGPPSIEHDVSMAREAFSSDSLASLIQTHDLYKRERASLPMGDVITRMRRVTSLEMAPTGATLSFSHEERYTAQKVTRDLLDRLMASILRGRAMRAQETLNFLERQAEAAAASWIARTKSLERAVENSPEWHRLVLDRELARRYYESLHGKLQDAQMVAELEKTKLGATLEVLDLPSLPDQPDSPNRPVILLGGLLGGLLCGALVMLVRALRATLVTKPLPVTEPVR